MLSVLPSPEIACDDRIDDGRTLIHLAGGGSRAHIAEVLLRFPSARVWTLNALRHERAELQFEIHAPVPRNGLDPHLPTILSPEAADPLPFYARRFPLQAACAVGEAFFELSHDYMLAFALLVHLGRLLPHEIPPGLSRRHFSRIYLCGVDLNDQEHFSQSRGVHFWAGMLRSSGVRVIPMPESTLFARAGRLGEIPDRPVRPYFYGQRRQALRVTSLPPVAADGERSNEN